MRAPDHALQRPWHFVIVEGERRDALGVVLNESLKIRGVTDEAQLKRHSKHHCVRLWLLRYCSSLKITKG